MINSTTTHETHLPIEIKKNKEMNIVLLLISSSEISYIWSIC